VLIAGAGALGSLVAQNAAMRGHEVIAIRRQPPVSTDGIRWFPADLVSGTGLAQVPHSPDVLLYCVTPDARTLQAYQRAYVSGLRRTLDALQPRRLILASSTSVYGNAFGAWVNETSEVSPATPMAEALLTGEQEVRSHPTSCIVRFTELYGPGRTRALRRAMSGADGRRCWTNRIRVEDAASAISHLIEVFPSERLFLASDDLPVTENALFIWLRDPKRLVPASIGLDLRCGKRVCNRGLRATGWSPQYPDYRKGHEDLIGLMG
jgi:nucleoside-diphosphate-sugar epimerase